MMLLRWRESEDTSTVLVLRMAHWKVEMPQVSGINPLTIPAFALTVLVLRMVHRIWK